MSVFLKSPTGAIALLSIAGSLCLPAEPPSLLVRPGPSAGEVRLLGSGSADGSDRVELSYGLEEWWPVHAVRETPHWEWSWEEGDELREGFFRLVDAMPPVIVPHAESRSGRT